jgi:hypothetical protein
MIAEPNRNRRASISLSPTLALFVAPYGKLYLRLQELVPENESVRASTPPKNMASSIEIADALLQATDFSNGYPK